MVLLVGSASATKTQYVVQYKFELTTIGNYIDEWVKISIAPYKTIIKGRQVPGAQRS